MEILDMLGQPCPIPVIQAKKALSKADCTSISVLVDNFVAVQNLEKMAKGIGYIFSHTESEKSQFLVELSKTGSFEPVDNDALQASQPFQTVAVFRAKGATVLISKNTLGSGDDDLGKILIKGFIFSLSELESVPACLIFLNSGVKLTVSDSNTIDDLQTLAEKGTKILVCGTCLNFYDLTDKLAVGEVVDMFTIVSELSLGSKVITV